MPFQVLSRPWGKTHDVVVFECDSLKEIIESFYDRYEDKFVDQFSLIPNSVREKSRRICLPDERDSNIDNYQYLPPQNRLRVVSHIGTIVSPKSLRDAYRKNARSQVVYTGRKRERYLYFRRPKTTQERRYNSFWLIEEGEPRPRAARNHKNLTNHWDDVVRSDVYGRNWKKFRDQRWKTINKKNI